MKQNNIHRRKIETMSGFDCHMVTFDVTNIDGGHKGAHRSITHRECIGRVLEKRMTAGLRFKHQGTGGITRNIDLFDGVHLDRYPEFSHAQCLLERNIRFIYAKGSENASSI